MRCTTETITALYLVDVLDLWPNVLLLTQTLTGPPIRGREKELLWAAHTASRKKPSQRMNCNDGTDALVTNGNGALMVRVVVVM